MDGIDIGLFDFDRHNALYYFIMNAQEQIYMRYGGRDSEAADTYLNLRSLERALQQGLDLHEKHLAGELPTTERPKSLFPRDVPLLMQRTIRHHNCVECHLIADYQNLELEQTGQLEKRTHMYRSPDIKKLGIYLDVPRGLVVAETKQAARQAGMIRDDCITHLNGQRLWTFGDLQYYYDKVSRDAQSITIIVDRQGTPVELNLDLPQNWWQTDLDYRHWSVDPLLYFSARPLSEDDKTQHGLKRDGFASVVTYVHPAVALLKRHELEVGDIVYAVDGVEQDVWAENCLTHIKLRKRAGSTVTLGVLRAGQMLSLPLKTEKQSFRK